MAVNNGNQLSWKEKAKENLDKAFELVHDVEKSYMEEPDKLLGLLKTSSQFYQYSINNLKLIYAQNPTAKYVQSFEAWKKDGFHVLRGQKGMKIFVPVRTTFLKLNDGEIVALSEASAEQKQQYKEGVIEHFQKTSYKIGNVFDITQTNCPIERYPELIGDNARDFSSIKQVYSATGTFTGLCKSIMISYYMGQSIDKEEVALFKKYMADYVAQGEEKSIKQLDVILQTAINDYKDLLGGRVTVEIPRESKDTKTELIQSDAKKKASIPENLYESMMELAPDIMSGEATDAQFDAGEHYDKLSVVRNRSNVISMAHTYEQNGDLMYDPYMEFLIDHDNRTLNAYYYELSSLGYNRCSIREDNTINDMIERELNEFAHGWFKNINYQGYKRVSEIVEKNITEETDDFLDVNIAEVRKKLEEVGIVNGQVVDEEALDNSSFIKQVVEDVKSISDSNVKYEEKRMLVKGDVIEYEGKRWIITENYNNFMISGKNLDPTDTNSSFQWIGSVDSHEFRIIKKTIVALESTEDYSDHENGFYTYHYQDGRNGIRYRLVTIGEDGYLKPYLSDKQFFITKELAEEYIEKNAALLDVISYDDIMHKAGYEIAKTQIEKKMSEQENENAYYFEVVECSEFHTMGNIYSEIDTASAAIQQFNDIKEAKRTLGPGINLIVRKGENKEEIPLASGINIDFDMFKYYPILETDDKAREKVSEFVSEARKNGFQTYGNYSLLNTSEQQNNGMRHRRGR